jgi:predicted dienelactone hydrolase
MYRRSIHKLLTVGASALAVSALLAMAWSVAADPAAGKPAAPAAAASITLPPPTGRFPVGTVSQRWVDTSRPDPFLPGRRREVLVQLWYPAAATHGFPPAQYLSAGAARAFERLGGISTPVFDRIRVYARHGAPAVSGPHPLVLFSPGFGMLDAFYTSLLEELASQGFIVLAIDHPYDAEVVEFPGGRLVPKRLDDDRPAQRDRALSTRIADTRFVLDQLAGLNVRGRLASRLDLSRIGMFGHSLGGATTAEVMLRDPRIDAGANLDGSFGQNAERRGVRGPFLLMTPPRGVGPSEQAYRAHLRRSQLRLTLRGAEHYTFTDFAATLPALARLAPRLRKELAVGSIDGRRVLTIERRYLAAFFRAHLKGTREPLLTHASAFYPEVSFERGTD